MKPSVPTIWKRLINLLWIALPILLLIACSGGGGAGQSATATPPTTTPPPTTIPPPATSISLTQVAGGFSSPVAITNAVDGSGRLFVVEQGVQSGSCATARSFPSPS